MYILDNQIDTFPIGEKKLIEEYLNRKKDEA